MWYLVSNPSFRILVVSQELKPFRQQVTEDIWSIIRALNKTLWDKTEDKTFPGRSWSKSHSGVKTSWGGQYIKICQILWRHTHYLDCASSTNINACAATANIYNLPTRDNPRLCILQWEIKPAYFAIKTCTSRLQWFQVECDFELLLLLILLLLLLLADIWSYVKLIHFLICITMNTYVKV